MSRKASPTVIGAFVLAGVGLLVIGVLIFGGRELFQEKQKFVTYFEGSVQGLRVGSNVLFRGVRVGYVTDIAAGTIALLEINPRPSASMVPLTTTQGESGWPLFCSISQRKAGLAMMSFSSKGRSCLRMIARTPSLQPQ